jgi:hypothetical protein
MKNNKGFTGLGLILAVIVVLVIGGVYYLWTKNTTYDMYQPLPKENNINNEESVVEVFNNQPGAIKSITTKGDNQWVLAVDLLTKNPNWIPGVDNTGEFFINQNTKIRNLNVTKDTKAYICGVDSEPNVLQDIVIFISNIQEVSYKTAYFDINGTNITAIYQQCLP